MPETPKPRRLTDQQVLEIRKSTESLSELARRFGVSRMTIRDIKRGTRYAKVRAYYR